MKQKLRLVVISGGLCVLLSHRIGRAEARIPLQLPVESSRIHVQNSAALGAPLTPANPDRDARLSYVAGELTANAPAERRWWYGWIGGFAALSAGQAYFFFTKDEPAERILNAVGGGMSFIGLVGLLVLPNAGRFADENLAELPERTPAERAAKLDSAERMLTDAQEATRRKRNAVAVIGPTLISFGTAAYVWAKYDAAMPALRTMVGSLAINIAHWWTRPTSNAEAARRYRGQSAKLDWQLLPWISPQVTGLGLGAVF
ncbi:MAG: hypothetical protein KC492_09395 [Myxococcales bacterium]|nr:hypothetical protein [Myxococcales bacterium]